MLSDATTWLQITASGAHGFGIGIEAVLSPSEGNLFGWSDWFWATLGTWLAAMGTLCAVVVSLFLPYWLNRETLRITLVPKDMRGIEGNRAPAVLDVIITNTGHSTVYIQQVDLEISAKCRRTHIYWAQTTLNANYRGKPVLFGFELQRGHQLVARPVMHKSFPHIILPTRSPLVAAFCRHFIGVRVYTSLGKQFRAKLTKDNLDFIRAVMAEVRAVDPD